MTARTAHKPDPEEPEEPETPVEPEPTDPDEEWPAGKPLTSNETGSVPREDWSSTKLTEES